MDEGHFEFENEETIDIRSFVIKCLHYWPYFVLCLIIAFIIAFLYIKFSPPVYKVKAWVLIHNEENLLDMQKLTGSSTFNNPNVIENEIGILQSKSLTERAIKELDFIITYDQEERFKTTALYNESPFYVEYDSLYTQPLNIKFNVSFISDTLIVIKSSGKDVTLYNYITGSKTTLPYFTFFDTVAFGQIAGNQYCRFMLLPNFSELNKIQHHSKYSFQFHSLGELVNQFRNVEVTVSKNSSILEISLKCSNVRQGVDYLNKLTELYLKKGVERDDKIATTTLYFIDNQLKEISDSLRFSEDMLQDFRTENKVLNLDFQARQVYQQLENLQNKKAELMVKSKYYNYLKEYLKENNNVDELIAPSSMDINDPLLNNLILELTQLYSERAELSFNSIRDNPYLKSLELKIADIKAKLLENIDNIIQSSTISLKETDNRLAEIESDIYKLPKSQRELLIFERKFKLNDAIYTYLLTKRSEVQISKASNIPSNEILDKASYDDYQLVSPNKKLSFIIAFLLGLLAPVSFVYLKDYFRNKITDKKDIQHITDLPLIGHIIHNKYKTTTVVKDKPTSLITESFRTLRTNFQFIANENEKNTVLLTSAITGEGKSFTAVNLGSVFAQNQKKTIIIDFDLRKPASNHFLDIWDNKGLSNFLSNSATLDEIINHSGIEYLDFISSGPVPPNPTELISSKQTILLFSKLRQLYDIIIIDSPPIGVVSDAFLLLKYANVRIIVLRHNFTPRNLFSDLMDDLIKRKIENLSLIINDIKINTNGYSYGYGYGYGYGYRYGDEDDKNRKKTLSHRLSALFTRN
jgi:capsular exopolysaccharide synthesis family protein